MLFMKKIIYFLTYLLLFILGFGLLNFANVLDLNAASHSETIAKFMVMIIVLLAITRWGIRLYIRVTGYKTQ
ncbi:hypothetical protein C2E44_03890 [Enterobacter ludwigii]|nr:hypothetical protein C2E44_03890 [Enterobacter ludwigii]